MAEACPDVEADRGLRWSLLAALLAAGMVYFTLPGVGLLIFGDYARAVLALAGAAACAIAVAALLRRIDWAEVVR